MSEILSSYVSWNPKTFRATAALKLSHTGHWSLAAQSQAPLANDCLVFALETLLDVSVE